MAKRRYKYIQSGAAARRQYDASRTVLDNGSYELNTQGMMYRQLTLQVSTNTPALNTGTRVPGANFGVIQTRHPSTGALQDMLGPSGATMRIDFINVMPLQLKSGIVVVSFDDVYDAYVAILADCV